MKVRFIFHKGKDSWIGKGIVAWTWVLALVSFQWNRLKDNYSHVEIWFPDENEEFEAELVDGGYTGVWIKTGQCFSSTTRGDAEGVRFAPASEVLHHPERWRYIECEVDEERVVSGMPRLKAKVGLEYDFSGVILGFSNPFNIQDEDKWYCSEIIAWVARLFRLIKYYKRISPRRLARVLADKYGEPKDLV